MQSKTYALPVLLAALAAAGCGGVSEPEAASRQVSPQAATKTCKAGSQVRIGSERRAYAAVVKQHATVYHGPGRRAFATFGRLNSNGVPTVLGVRAKVVGRHCEARWYHVQVPRRPNGVTGYVHARDVTVASVRTRIVVDISERRVTLFRRGKPVIEATAAVGSSATPTPVGRYYVNQRLIPTDPHGPYGPGAVGVSAFSNVLTGWTQGGPIAIHGTNAPWSIGRAVTNGCIRLPNPVLRRLFASTLAGTPVIIRP